MDDAEQTLYRSRALARGHRSEVEPSIRPSPTQLASQTADPGSVSAVSRVLSGRSA